MKYLEFYWSRRFSYRTNVLFAYADIMERFYRHLEQKEQPMQWYVYEWRQARGDYREWCLKAFAQLYKKTHYHMTH